MSEQPDTARTGHDDLVKAPFDAYTGDEPYLFVSYSHNDKVAIYEDIAELHQLGYRIWYDSGIRGGDKFASEIEGRIARCQILLVFLSENVYESDTEWVHRELSYAIKLKKTIIAVFLDESPPRGGFDFLTANLLNIYRFKFIPDNAQEYFTSLARDIPVQIRQDDDITLFRILLTDMIAECNILPYESLLELGEGMGLDPTVVERTIAETISPIEKFRKQVRLLLEFKPLGPTEWKVVGSLAKKTNLALEVMERWIQKEAVEHALTIRETQDNEYLIKLLQSSIGRTRLTQYPPLDDLLNELLPPKAASHHEAVTTTTAAEPDLPAVAHTESPRDAAPDQAEAEAAAPPAAPVTFVEQVAAVPQAVNAAVTFVDNNLMIEWVQIPAGTFRRGCPADFIRYVEQKFSVDASVFSTFPERDEELATFWVGRTPITNVQFYAFIKATGHRYPVGWRGTRPPYSPADADKPVTGVNWQDCAAFAQWLGARLPLRAEYEKACRGTHGQLYPWGNTFDPQRCNTAESDRGLVLPAGAIADDLSPFGVLDLVGNVWQWAEDGEGRMKRTVGASYLRIGEIYGAGFFDVSRPADEWDKDLGFRLACSDLTTLKYRTEVKSHEYR